MTDHLKNTEKLLSVGIRRHGAEALLAYLREELSTAALENQFGRADPTPLTATDRGFLELAESTFTEAMRTDGLTFMFPRACSEYLCQCITRHLDAPFVYPATIPLDTREELTDLRSQLRKARLLGLPLSVARKYDFDLKTAAYPFVRVSFTEDELRKLARGTHDRPLDPRPQYTQSTVAFEIRLTLASLELLRAAQAVLRDYAEPVLQDRRLDALQSAVNEYRAAFTNLPKGMNDHPLNAGENK
jgi:hypothetical protein